MKLLQTFQDEEYHSSDDQVTFTLGWLHAERTEVEPAAVTEMSNQHLRTSTKK